MANKLSVAFIGTGIMGAPIAGHILDAGYPVTVNNRTKSKAAALIERGAVWADTPADAAANADVVFTMVGYPSEVEELYLAGDGLLACTKPGAVLIDLTTSSPELARDIAEAAQVSGRMAFDCPVTGGESGAIAGTLTAIVGATENDIAPVRDILATFAANICCFDGAGKGQAAKLANQVSQARREKRLYSFSLQVSGAPVKRQKIARQARNFIEKGRILCYTEPKRQM